MSKGKGGRVGQGVNVARGKAESAFRKLLREHQAETQSEPKPQRHGEFDRGLYQGQPPRERKGNRRGGRRR